MAEEFERISGRYLLNVVEDAPDFRDYEYQPALVQLSAEVPRPDNLKIRDQGREGACTGFGLAAAIDLQLSLRGETDRNASTRMLYETAKQFDEWEGEDYHGSSCRGAVKGWHSMGVCDEALAPYQPDEKGWVLSVDQGKDARRTTLGAYYRVNKKISDYHAAINEVGALYVSAMVHKGWQPGSIRNGVVGKSDDILGGHAFAIIGYDDRGFWVQNSWGQNWGEGGTALWPYEDWLVNGRDAWVLRLGVSTPQIWHIKPTVTRSPESEGERAQRSPTRGEVIGHFVHIDDGRFDERGKYGTDLETVKKTASFLAGTDEYEHLLLYAHGGLNDVAASARRVAAMKETFKANGIYPFHFMYDTGLLEEIKDIVLGHEQEVEMRAGGITDFTDKLIEKATRHIGRAIWREMKYGATTPFSDEGAGTQTITAFLEAFAADAAKKKKVHLAGHSTGAILLGNLLTALGRRADAPRIRTVSLFAPACTHDLFHETFKSALAAGNGFGIDRMVIYNLHPDLELDDTVTPVYRKSLLYLVSNAYEESPPERLLGMQMFRNRLGPLPGGLAFEISEGTAGNKNTESTTHGGFDNDAATMNSVLRSVLGGEPRQRFEPEDLVY